jgi:hypothetical protein
MGSPRCNDPLPAATSGRKASATTLVSLPGIQEIWQQTLGDPDIGIAVLDGPVDLAHPCFRGARLSQLTTLANGKVDRGAACRHGTQVTSILFGRHDGPVCGIAPSCRGIIVPIFESGDGDELRACSQLDLARALGQALQHDARIINVSGGQFAPSGTAHPILADAVADCARRGALIVAAAGNDGCACLHVPAALDSVIAVGAMSAAGEPLGFSNWGGIYQVQGILAPGENIQSALPGGGTARFSGTSPATAIVSGVAALLMSLERRHGRRPDARLVRAALLRSARGCDDSKTTDCRRLLAGRLNVTGAVSIIIHQGIHAMSEAALTQPENAVQPQNEVVAPAPAPAGVVMPSAVVPAACSCQGANTPPQLVYVIGQPGYDLISEARLDSLAQKMAAGTADRSAPLQPERMLAYLDAHPWDAAAVEWTLGLDGTPVYALRPQGPFAADTYKELRGFLREYVAAGVERVSLPGVITGKARLLNGQVVPVVAPELRGMYSWTTTALVEAVTGPPPAEHEPAETKVQHEQRRIGLRNFFARVYHALRNLGVTPADRAVNYAATNAYSVEKAFEAALKERERVELDAINVVRSPICRPSSDCWDVEIYFFFPDRPVQTVRKVYRFTVDVSDTVPVTVGPMRSWFTR